MTDKERMRAFMDDLGKLCAQYQVKIDACGCCGSPWVQPADPAEPIVGRVHGQYYELTNQYELVKVE